MRHPSGRRLLQALVVVDVDLDTREVREVHRPAAGTPAPEGVHAVAWHHGVPVGELTVPGDPDDVLRRVLDLAQQRCATAVAEHQVRDALAVPGGLERAAASLEGVPHPPMPGGAPAVTVAVCTRDRPEDLRRCLQAVVALRGPGADVLVVDNAPSDERTRAVVAAFPGVRWVREPRRGLDHARNRALLEATTPVVAFTDDDVLVHPGWVQGLLRAFAEEPDAVAVTGLVLPAELATPAQVLFEARGGFGRGCARQWFNAAVADGEVAGVRHAWIGAAGTGADLAVRREEVLALGGFDTALDVGTPTGGGGDIEMLYRVVAAGGLVVYEPSAVVRHRHRADPAGLRRQRSGDGTGAMSWWLGAGAGYPPAERSALRRAAVAWALHHHLRRLALSALWPAVWPRGLAVADATGAVRAVVGRTYRRAQRQAALEVARHPAEPSAPPRPAWPVPVRRPPHHRQAVEPPVVVVDLEEDQLATGRAPLGAAPLDVRLVVRAGAAPLGEAVVASHGAALSPARLRWEVVRQLGWQRCWQPVPTS